MVLESSQQPVKRGRGRPRKVQPEAVTPSSSKKIARKNSAPETLATWEDELIAFEKRSNKSGVLTLLILLLGIALIGYGMYLKLKQTDDSDRVDHSVVTTQTNQTGTKQIQAPVPASTATLITDFFTRVNNGQFDTLAVLEDVSFKSGPLKNYFNTTRLQTFTKNIIGGITIEKIIANTKDPVAVRNANAQVYDFTMIYTLKSNEIKYSEPRTAYIITKGTGHVINGFVYQGTGVSNSPFFQFKKFGIQ